MKKGGRKQQNHIKVHHGFAIGIVAFWAVCGALIGATALQQNAEKASAQVLPVVSISLSNEKVITNSPSPFEAPPGYKFIAINLDIKNNSENIFHFAPVVQTKIVDSNGKSYEMAPTMLVTPIKAGPISPGESVKGELSYLVPENITEPKYEFSEPSINLTETKALNLR